MEFTTLGGHYSALGVSHQAGGLMDNFYFEDAALSAEQIAALYAATSSYAVTSSLSS